MRKNIKLLMLPCAGFILFIIGTLIPSGYSVVGYGLMGTGVLLTLLFYFITLSQLIKSFSRNSSKKIFWMVAIICVPVIGNIIYLIFSETANRLQKPQEIW